MSAFLEKLHHITTFIFDVDGVLTDGSITILENGDQLRTMNIKDGYAMQLAVKKGYRVAIISGGKSAGVISRLKGLGLVDIYTGISHKIDTFNEYCEMHSLKPEEILYMGDDIPDYIVMQKAGIAACPQDATHEIREISAYVSAFPGGKGAVRDVIEKTMRLHGKWQMDDRFKW